MPIDISGDIRTPSFGSQTISSYATSGSSSSSSSSREPAKLRQIAFGSDPCRDAIARIANPDGSIAISDLRFVQRLGCGDIGSVYLAEVKSAAGEGGGGGGVVVAAKVMDKKELVGRKKSGRAKTEKEILEMLDHPFLPRLYGCAENERFTSLLTEFCPGGDLHVLRQRQPHKRFDEHAVRFYAAEVVAALEYIHMLGIIYRDLKPENVLVRSDGHIMLTDFDLSLKSDSDSSPAAQLLPNHHAPPPSSSPASNHPPATAISACILPNCIVPAVSCFRPSRRRRKPVHRSRFSGDLVFVAEPVDLRSTSFVGTHEYLAPEIVSGEGHGSSVDWWTLGVFIFELMYGTTPFRGADNEMTLSNIVARALEIPKNIPSTAAARDLVSGLLAKDPEKRLGSSLGATAVKTHPFFGGVNWALLRCAVPPHVPPPFVAAKGSFHDLMNDDYSATPVEYF